MSSVGCLRTISQPCCLVRAQPLPSRCRSVRVCSTRPDGNGDSTAGSPTGAAMDAIDTFLQKYDVLSALMGSLVVTTIAVSRGQSLGMAAMLTVSSTVMALVANEVFFEK